MFLFLLFFFFRKNACIISNDLDDVFEEINIPENPDYKNRNTEKYGKLTENTNSKDTIFNFENNLINKLEQKNNKNQVSNLNVHLIVYFSLIFYIS